MKKEIVRLASSSLCLAALSLVYAASPEGKNIPLAVSPKVAVKVPENLIPKGYLVLNQATAKLQMSDKRFGRVKVAAPDGQKKRIITVNEQGEEVDFEAILREDKQAYRDKYGKMEPSLYDRVMSSGAEGLIPVTLWIAVKPEPLIDKKRFSVEELLEGRGEVSAFRQHNQEARSNVRDLLRKRLRIEVPDESQVVAPTLYLELTPKQIWQLNTWQEVAGLFLRGTQPVVDLANSMSISHADVVVNTWGWSGSGINVCIWEYDSPNPASVTVADYYTTASTANHATLVGGIIQGYAPGATIYSANSIDPAALNWCVSDQLTSVVNQSFHDSTEETLDTLSVSDLEKDYLVVQSPYPTIIQAAGNGDATEYVNHKGYNSLTVGSHNDDATAMATDSVFRNPTTPNDDRELPELAANGMGVTAVGLTMSGTSFASPAVVGTVALLQEVEAGLTVWPEGVRAVLLAGATQNVTGGLWGEDIEDEIDAHDGAGALNAEESVQIASHWVVRNSVAIRRGWDADIMSDCCDFDENGDSIFSYSVQVPNTGGTHVKVALAWDSKVDSAPFTSELAMDLDLKIYEGNTLIASSQTFDNSYEIVEFEGTPSQTYTIGFSRAGQLVDESTYYGVAWTVF